jgi:CRISPR system Cascade subunit CasD
MVASALGVARGDAEALANLCLLDYGVRVDAPGIRITDYQTTAFPQRKNDTISYRDYLCDAVFIAGLFSEDMGLVERVRYALLHPIHPLYLGRRSCPPAQPLVLGVREKDLHTALVEEPLLTWSWLAAHDRPPSRLIIEEKRTGVGKLVRDVPISFDQRNRAYTFRFVSETRMLSDLRTQQTSSNDHDAFAEAMQCS